MRGLLVFLSVGGLGLPALVSCGGDDGDLSDLLSLQNVVFNVESNFSSFDSLFLCDVRESGSASKLAPELPIFLPVGASLEFFELRFDSQLYLYEGKDDNSKLWEAYAVKSAKPIVREIGSFNLSSLDRGSRFLDTLPLMRNLHGITLR